MNEAETRAELIDPLLKHCGWGVTEGSKVLRERNVCKITDGRIQPGGRRTKPLIADYILVHKGIKLAVVEAKADVVPVVKAWHKPNNMPKNFVCRLPIPPTETRFISST